MNQNGFRVRDYKGHVIHVIFMIMHAFPNIEFVIIQPHFLTKTGFYFHVGVSRISGKKICKLHSTYRTRKNCISTNISSYPGKTMILSCLRIIVYLQLNLKQIFSFNKKRNGNKYHHP